MGALWKSPERGRGSVWSRPRSKLLQLRFNLDGKEYRESAETSDLEEAKRVLARRLKTRDAASLGHRDAFDAHKASKRRLVDVLNYYRSARQPSDPKRARQFAGHLKPVLRDFAEMRADQLTSAAIAAYIAAQRKAGRADGTTLHTLCVLKAAVRCAHRAVPPLLPSTITVEIPPNLKAGKRKGKFSPEEWAALSKELPPVWVDPATFLYWSGWRTGEMESATWDDVRQGPGGSLRLVLPSERSKNDDARALQLVGELRTLYERRCQQRLPGCDLIFHVKGKPFRVSNRRDSWNSACERAGLGHRLRHDFRRSTVTDLCELGIPSEVGQSISGHRSNVYQAYNCPPPTDPAQVRALLQRQAFVQARIEEQAERQKQWATIITPIGPGPSN